MKNYQSRIILNKCNYIKKVVVFAPKVILTSNEIFPSLDLYIKSKDKVNLIKKMCELCHSEA